MALSGSPPCRSSVAHFPVLSCPLSSALSPTRLPEWCFPVRLGLSQNEHLLSVRCVKLVGRAISAKERKKDVYSCRRLAGAQARLEERGRGPGGGYGVGGPGPRRQGFRGRWPARQAGRQRGGLEVSVGPVARVSVGGIASLTSPWPLNVSPCHLTGWSPCRSTSLLPQREK